MEQKKINLGVIILGAQVFPNSNGKFEGSPAFFESKKKIKQYFSDEDGYNLDPDLIEDIFDSDMDPDQTDIRIGIFIGKLKHRSIGDLVIYYVGHGTLTRNSGFILALKNSRFDNFDTSSLSFRNFASSLVNKAKDFRIYLILDCCFSGSALGGFQSANAEATIIRVQFEEEFATSGVALLCSSSKDLPSQIVEERNVTMFTEGLEIALRKGDPAINFKLLNLYDLRETTYLNIRNNNAHDDVVRPEIHVPLQNKGDVGKNRLFPNHAYQITGLALAYDIDSRRNAIEKAVLADDMKNASTQFLSFVKDFDKKQKYAVDMILIGTRCNVEDAKPKPPLVDGVANEQYDKYMERRFQLYRDLLNIVMDLWMNKPI